MKPENIYVADKRRLQQKIKIAQTDGAAAFHAVADFDRTLTKAFVDGKRFVSTYALIREGKYLTPDYPARAQALFDKYHPYETSTTISPEEKNRKMDEWWNRHFGLLQECGMSKAVISDIIEKRKIQFREGAWEFLDIVAKHKVPLLIMSAGIGDIIKELLVSAGKLTPNIHLLSNFYTFDENGKVSGRKNKTFIHSFNKNEVEVRNTPYYKEIAGRRNVLLLGDSLGDLGMTEGFKHDEIIRIGFLNENKEKFLEKYLQEFDVVITDDGEMGIVKKIVTEVIGSS